MPGVERVDADATFLTDIREWCEKNGPLGVLLGGLEAFTTAPRYRPGKDPGTYWRDRSLYPSARTYELSAGQWRIYDTESTTQPLPSRGSRRRCRYPARGAGAHRARFQRTSLLPLLPSPGNALCRDFRALGGLSSWCLQPLSRWWTFFPARSFGERAFDYPEPLTDEFWRLHTTPPDAAGYDLPSPSSEEFRRDYAEPLERSHACHGLRRRAAWSASLRGGRMAATRRA